MTKHYLSILGLIIFASLLCAGMFNWFVNPYSIYSGPEIERINKDKVEFLNHLRLTKAHQVARQKPTAVILGTSRTGRGLDPDHPGWGEHTVYNLALPSASMYELLRYFQHANAIQPLRKVVIALDYRCFTSSKTSEGFSDARMRVTAEGIHNNGYILGLLTDMASTLFSTDALVASLRNIRRQGWSKQTLYEKGRWDRITEQYQHRKAFNFYMNSTINRIGNNLATHSYSPTEFDAFRTFLRTAYSNNIEVYLVISPSHALHWEIYQTMGLWNKFENLKHDLVKINDEEARRAGKQAFPLWDFSGYNSISIEPVPNIGDTEARMQWFWESVHYKKRLGDAVLDRIFEIQSDVQTVPEDFGFKLTSKNIEAHLTQQRQAQQHFLKHNKSDIKKIEELAAKFL